MPRTVEQIAAEARAARAVLARFKPLVEEYLAASGVSQTRFGMNAAGHIDFMRYLRRENRDFRVSTIDNVLKHIGEAGELDVMT